MGINPLLTHLFHINIITIILIKRRVVETPGIYIYYMYIPGVSTTLRFWGRLQNTSFLGTFDTLRGRFIQKRPFIFQAGAGYIQ